MTGFADLPPEDQQAIGKTLLTLLIGFLDRDAEALQAVYSDNADWVNACPRDHPKGNFAC